MPSWPTGKVVERVIDAHFQQLIDMLEEILVELKKQTPPGGVTGGGVTGVNSTDLIGKQPDRPA